MVLDTQQEKLETVSPTIAHRSNYSVLYTAGLVSQQMIADNETWITVSLPFVIPTSFRFLPKNTLRIANVLWLLSDDEQNLGDEFLSMLISERMLDEYFKRPDEFKLLAFTHPRFAHQQHASAKTEFLTLLQVHGQL